MELFFSQDIEDGIVTLGDEEAVHCTRVLRHKVGDVINVIDGQGTLYRCRLLDVSQRNTVASVEDIVHGWGGHPYVLTMAVCPTKNPDRYEWFAEKACELGVDNIVPVIGDHSERRIFKGARLGKILVSATKQSLKASVPSVAEPVSVRDWIIGLKGASAPDVDGNRLQYGNHNGVLKLIAYCFEDENHPRMSIKQALDGFDGTEIAVLIGPEGDFSKEEATLALESGFIPVHLGPSRLRTETAALAAVGAVYSKYQL